jgi:hypothetical protein
MSDDLAAIIAGLLRKRYESENYAEVCAHCSDDWADNVAAAVVDELIDLAGTGQLLASIDRIGRPR